MTNGLLLLHVFPVDASMWEPQLAAIRGELAVVAPNFPGFGDAPLAGEVSTMDEAAEVAAAEVAAAGLDRVVVCGLSMGGYVAFAFRRKFRDRVAGLVLANTRAGADDEAGRERRRALAQRLRAEGNEFLVESPPPLLSSEAPAELWNHVKSIIATQSAEAIAAASLGMAERPDSTADLPVIDVPTLVITSSANTLIPPDATSPMADAIPRAQFSSHVPVTDLPLVVLLSEDRSYEPNDRVAVGEDPDDVGAPSDLPVQSLLGVVGPDLAPVLGRERAERGDVGSGVGEDARRLGECLLELGDHPVELRADLGRGGLGEDRADQGGHHGLGRLGDVGLQVAHEVGATPLPRRSGKRCPNRMHQAQVIIGDHELHTGEASYHEVPEERRPARAVLGGEDVEAQDLPPPVAVDRRPHHRGHGADPTGLPAPDLERIEPHVRVRAAVEGPGPERLDLLVQVLGEGGNLRLGDALDAERLHQSVHPPSGDALHVALRHHLHEGPLRAPAGLHEPGGEVASGPELRHEQVHRSGPGVALARAVPVAAVHSIGAPLAVRCAAHRVCLGGHEGLDERPEHLPQQIDVGFLEVLAEPHERVHSWFDHRVPPLRVPWSVLVEDEAVVSYFKDPQAVRTPRAWTLSGAG